MLSKFLGSQMSGYLFLLTAVAVVALVAYIFNEGKQACEAANKDAGLTAIGESLKNTEEVERKVNEVSDIDKLLHDLGIMRRDEDY